MSLAPSPHPLGAFALAKVRKICGLAIPAPLAGELAGPVAIRFSAVALMLPVPVIREEKGVAAPALTSLRLWAHREPTPTQPPSESKQNHRAEEEPKQRSKKSFQENSRKKRPGKKKGISNRRFCGNIIPPLTARRSWAVKTAPSRNPNLNLNLNRNPGLAPGELGLRLRLGLGVGAGMATLRRSTLPQRPD